MLDLRKMKSLREAAGLTLEQASKAAGFTNAQQWHLIESGRRSNITMDTLGKIAKALGVKSKDLLK
jgi:transcriptional regulator with XRE-family HTH domain